MAMADTGTSLGDRSGEGTTAFTGLAGSPEANLFTGALSTRISIMVPPGRKHMTPDVALEYSSSGGPSPYGYGWNLTLGQIERTTRWGVPHCDSDHFDEFVLTLPGGVTAELVSVGSDEYRPRVEQKYLSATFLPGSNRWEAYDAAGMKYTFGDVKDARLGTDVDDPPLEQPNLDGSCDFTTAWALTKIEDATGNTLEVTYADKAWNGNHLLPEWIRYGGHASGLEHFHTVQFFWLENSGGTIPPPTYRRGVPQRMRTSLWKVEVSTEKSPAGLIRRYEFAGAGTTSLYQLHTVTVEDLPPQHFFYTDWVGDGHEEAAGDLDIPAGFGSASIRSSGTATGNVIRTVMDMNGDGLLDLVRSDVWSSGNQRWSVYLGALDPQELTISFAVSATSWSAPNTLIREVRDTNCKHAHLCTVRDTFDINGDGIPDYVVASRDHFDEFGSWGVHVGRKSGSSWEFGAKELWSAPTWRLREYTDQEIRRDVIDMTGDGLPDYVLADEEAGVWLVFRNTGSGFAANPIRFAVPPGVRALNRTEEASDVQPARRTTLMVTDLNGDGLPDLLEEGQNGSEVINGVTHRWKSILVWFNVGQGFSAEPRVVKAPSHYGCLPLRGTSPSSGTLADLLDVNGDGLPDCVVGGSVFNGVALNIGGDFEPMGATNRGPTFH